MNNYNILLITIDCFRYDRITANGYKINTTPNIDQFIKEGINFRQAIAGGPSTMAAFPCLFASSYPIMYGGTRYLSEDRTTIAQVLSRVEYKTIGLSSNPYITPEFGYDRGFWKFQDFVKRTRNRDKKKDLLSKVIKRDSSLWNLLRKMARSGEIKKGKGLYPSASEINQNILNLISENKGTPFFIWAHYMDLHYPYVLGNLDLASFLGYKPSVNDISDMLSKLMKEPSMFCEKEKKLLNAIYDASLSYIDQKLGELFHALQKFGIWDNLIIIITADHGEELLEEGRFGHGDEGQKTLFPEALIHIPLILKVPVSMYSGKKIDVLVSQVDIAPTILDMIGLDIPNNWYGHSLVPLIKKEKNIIRDAAITQRGIEESFAMSWRTNEWKLVYNAFEQRTCLFKIGSSSDLHKDLSATYPDIVEKLKDAIFDHLKKYESVYTKKRLEAVQLDEDLQKQLKDLGYL